MMTIRPFRRATVLALLLPVLAGCATQDELLRSKDENIRLSQRVNTLQREVDRLSSDLDGAHAGLAEANLRLQDALSGPNFEALTSVGIGVNMRGNDLVISVPSSISFSSGSAELTDSGQAAVRVVAGVLRSDYGNSDFWVEGHTDSQQPSRSGFTSNRSLSVERAMSVLTFLVDECGVPDASCVVAGHGEYTPLGDNNSPDGMARNRRVEIVVHQRQ